MGYGGYPPTKSDTSRCRVFSRKVERIPYDSCYKYEGTETDMKRTTTLAVAVASASLVLTACGSESTADAPSTPAASQESSAGEIETEALAEVQPSDEVTVDGTSLTTVTYSKEYIDNMSKRELKAEAEANGWDTEITLNSDGSVTYTMTRNEYDRILEGYRQAIEERIQSTMDEDALLYESVTFTEDFTTFEVTVNASQEVLFLPRIFSIRLADAAYRLKLFSGVEDKDNFTVVNTIEATTGEVIDTYDSSWLG